LTQLSLPDTLRDSFAPTKPYRSRLSWKDQGGNTQSKLLFAAPERALSMAVRSEPKAKPMESPPPSVLAAHENYQHHQRQHEGAPCLHVTRYCFSLRSSGRPDPF